MPYALAPDIPYMTALSRGLKRRCPRCGEGKAFEGYLKVAERCPVCDENLGRIRADDLPPYLTIFLVGHIVVPLALIAEQNWAWSVTKHMTIWLPLTLTLLLTFLPLLKGLSIGLMWRLGITGRDQ